MFHNLTYSIRSLVSRWKSVSYITVKLFPAARCENIDKEITITKIALIMLQVAAVWMQPKRHSNRQGDNFF